MAHGLLVGPQTPMTNARCPMPDAPLVGPFRLNPKPYSRASRLVPWTKGTPEALKVHQASSVMNLCQEKME